jgi:hypothetical protein
MEEDAETIALFDEYVVVLSVVGWTNGGGGFFIGSLGRRVKAVMYSRAEGVMRMRMKMRARLSLMRIHGGTDLKLKIRGEPP